MIITSQWNYPDVKPLRDAGWEYLYMGKRDFGWWVDPLTGIEHRTPEAVKIQAKR